GETAPARGGEGAGWRLPGHEAAQGSPGPGPGLSRGRRASTAPPIAEGFYYDFEFPDGTTINEGDFEKIEAQMRKHIKAAEPFVRSEATTAEAIDRYLREDQPYKVELIEDLVKNQGVTTVGIYTN